MMPSILRWIVPNRVDRQILAVLLVLLLAAGIVAIGGNYGVDPAIRLAAVYVFFGALFSVPAAVGTQSWRDVKKSIPLLTLTLLSLGLIVLLVDWDQLWNQKRTAFNNARSLNDANRIFLNYTGLSILVVAYFGTLLVSWAFSRVVDRLLGLQLIRKQNRVRLLVYFVVFLFVCFQLQRLLESYPIPLTAELMMICGAVLLIPATYLLCRLQRWWVRSIVFVLLFSALASAVLSTQSIFEQGRYNLTVSLLGAPLGYFVILMLIWRPVKNEFLKDAVWDDGGIPDRRWPSIWGFGALSAAILIAVASLLVDLTVAWQFGGSEGLKIARFIRRLQQTSGAVTTYHFEGNRETLAAGLPTGVTIEAAFRPESDPDYFGSFAELENPVILSLILHNLNLNVETTALNGIEKRFASIEGSCLSTKQLLDLIIGCQYVHVSDCQFENSNINPNPDPKQTWPQHLTLYQIPSGQVAIAVNTLQTAGFSGTLHVHSCKLNDGDWRAIGGLQNTIAISIHDCPPPKSFATRTWLKEKLTDQNRRQIGVGQVAEVDKIWSYIDSNMRITTAVSPFESEGETWDALFVGGLSLSSPSAFLEKFLVSENLNQDLVDFNLVFDPVKNPDAIRHVVIPVMNVASIEQTSALTDLEILSFDTDWFSDSLRTQSDSRYYLFDLQPLGKLTNLKELYFPKRFYLDNFQFFAKLPNLEVLQFDAFHESRLYNVPNVKAEFFPNLKQIRLFSEPHPKLLLELAKLKQLERLDMVNSEAWFETAEDQEKLKSIFDESVEVRFLKASDYPAPPDSFRQHLKQVKQDVRKRRIPIAEGDSD